MAGGGCRLIGSRHRGHSDSVVGGFKDRLPQHSFKALKRLSCDRKPPRNATISLDPHTWFQGPGRQRATDLLRRKVSEKSRAVFRLKKYGTPQRRSSEANHSCVATSGGTNPWNGTEDLITLKFIRERPLHALDANSNFHP